MIAFKDFAPPQTKPGGLLTLAEYDMLGVAVQAANVWVKRENVQVINVETVVLPNLWHSDGSGTGDPMLRTSHAHSNDWYQFVRVWYRDS